MLVALSFAAGLSCQALVSESDILTPTKVLLFRILEKGKPSTTSVP